jgi:inorganic triphosphatase YgiF
MIHAHTIRFQAPDPKRTNQLWDHPLVRTTGTDPTFNERTFIYHDTPEAALFRNGIELTVNQAGKGWEQTIVDLTEGRRVQYVLDTPHLDHAKLAKSGLGKRLMPDQKQWNALVPLLRMRQITETRLLQFPDGTKIRLTREQGAYQPRSATTDHPFDEVILTLEEEGTEERLFQVALTLMYALSAGMTCAGPIQRAVFGVAPDLLKATLEEPYQLTREQTTETGFTHIVDLLLNSLSDNHCMALNGHEDIRFDGLYALHTTVGKLRVIFTLHQAILPKEIVTEVEQELTWLANELVEAIEWELFINGTLEPFTVHFAQKSDLTTLQTNATARRRAAYERAHAALTHMRLTRIALGISEWLDSKGWRDLLELPKREWLARPVSDMAEEVLGRHHYQLHNVASAPEASEEAGLRHMAQESSFLEVANTFYAPLYGEKRAVEYRQTLATAHNALKTLHYTHVASRLFESISAGQDAPSTHLFTGWLGAREASQMQAFRKAWAQFAGQTIYWQI